MFSKNVLGSKLREIRTTKNLTLQHVAEAINSTKSTLSNIERGVKPASFDIVIELANYYGVSIDYLLGATDFPFPLSEKVLNIISQANNPEEIMAAIQELSKSEKSSRADGQPGSNEVNDLIKDLDEDSIKELRKYVDYLKVRQTLDKGNNESSAGLDTAGNK